MAPTLLWAGLGNMGRGMCKNIVDKGNLDSPLLLYNRSTKRSVDLSNALPKGKTEVVEDIRSGVTRADVIFSCIANDEAVQELFAAMLKVDIAGKLFIDSSTIHPDTTEAVAAAVVLSTAAVSVVYVRSGNILIHVAAFISQLTIIWPRTVQLVYYRGRSADEKRQLMALWWKAVAALGTGYALWHVDLEFCDALRSVRAMVGLPFAWTLELHGWWHILTAIGASQYMQLIRKLTEETVPEKGLAKEGLAGNGAVADAKVQGQ
ncbi:hypothetical protein G7046_g3362 [Stylonectria norvegica]|nr:hypothetical protein G7046_g3362 [Stylonectria norvegica]